MVGRRGRVNRVQREMLKVPFKVVAVIINRVEKKDSEDV